MEHTTTIDNIPYKTTTLLATRGLTILPKLIALFGEPLLKVMFSADEDEKEHMMEEPRVIAAILHGISLNASDGELLVLRDLMETTESDQTRMGEAEVPGNIRMHFDTHFAGRYMHLAKVAKWVGSCNFTEL